MATRRRRESRFAPVTAKHDVIPFPSPTGGIDVTQQLAGGDPLTATILENLIPSVQGLDLRAGYTQWQAGLPAQCRTIMTYVPADNSDPKVFAALANGAVADISVRNQAVIPISTTIAGQTDPGVVYWINFNNDAGSFLLVVAPGAGYFVYDGGSWTEITEGVGAGQIDGIDPADFTYIWEWGKRVWFIQTNSMVAWYLPVNQISGEVTAFPLGALSTAGGSLYVGVNWTVDGGGGVSGSSSSISNKLVFITQQGDIIIYNGTDPDFAETFALEGKWFIGRMPRYRRAVGRFGSDIVMLSERGLSFLSELLRGQGFFQNSGFGQRVNARIAPIIARQLDRQFWEVVFLPKEQMIVINLPTLSSEIPVQLAFIINGTAFTNFVNMPMSTLSRGVDRPLFADFDTTIWVPFEGTSDGETPEARGRDIEGNMVTTFQPMGNAVQQKRALMAKVQLTAIEPPAINMVMLTSFSRGSVNSPSFLSRLSALWDTAQWDVAQWAGEEEQYTFWSGVVGVGPYVALAMRIRGVPGTRFVTWMAVVEAGNILGT